MQKRSNTHSACHPDRPFFAKNMCEPCYGKQYRADEKRKKTAKEYTKLWQNKNKDKANLQKATWAKNNPEKVKAAKKAYVSRNLNLYRAMCAKRHAAKMQRTPAWADLNAIKNFYLNCPDGMEVDHIIPLQGDNISGLHVLENLQYLTPAENRKKHNKFKGNE